MGFRLQASGSRRATHAQNWGGGGGGAEKTVFPGAEQEALITRVCEDPYDVVGVILRFSSKGQGFAARFFNFQLRAPKYHGSAWFC